MEHSFSSTSLLFNNNRYIPYSSRFYNLKSMVLLSIRHELKVHLSILCSEQTPRPLDFSLLLLETVGRSLLKQITQVYQ